MVDPIGRAAHGDHSPDGTDLVVTVVFVHGFLDDAAIWLPVQSALSLSVRTVAIDLAGMGARTSESGPYSLERFAADVGDAIDKLGGPVVLVGHSMGAQVAELVAVDRSERVAALILAAPVPLGGTQFPDSALAAFHDLAHASAGQHRATRMTLSGGTFPEPELARLAESGSRLAAAVVSQLVRTWNNGVAQGQRASAYTGPVLALVGQADGFVTAHLVAEAVTPRFADVEVVHLSGAGHWAHAEHPSLVAAEIERFVQARLGRRSDTAPGVGRQGWTEAFQDKQASAFAQTLAADVRLEASTLHAPVHGTVLVQQVMAAASGLYESLVFTHQATNGDRTYLEWQAEAFGGVQLDGVTILTKDSDGRIMNVAIHHRPLAAVLQFSHALGERLAGILDTHLTYKELP